MKFAVCLEYDGADFSGWQSQAHARSVQDCVEAAFSAVADHEVRVVCAGRTDAGVHATGQIVHFESGAARAEDDWLRGANSHLPGDVRARWVRAVDTGFHARFGALRRRYRYVILNAPTASALLRRLTAPVRRPLDAGAMHDAAQALVGEHDFSGYRGAGCRSRTPMRRVESVAVRRDGRFVHVDICANAFLQHMVRNIVGVLVEIGCGDRPRDHARRVLEWRDRTRGGVTAAGAGLYLVAIEYDARYALPGDAVWPRF